MPMPMATHELPSEADPSRPMSMFVREANGGNAAIGFRFYDPLLAEWRSIVAGVGYEKALKIADDLQRTAIRCLEHAGK